MTGLVSAEYRALRRGHRHPAHRAGVGRQFDDQRGARLPAQVLRHAAPRRKTPRLLGLRRQPRTGQHWRRQRRVSLLIPLFLQKQIASTTKLTLTTHSAKQWCN